MSIPNARTWLAKDIARGVFSHSKTPVGRLVAGARSTVGRWFTRSRQRRVLREIAERNDFHMLKDIGVTQEEALREAHKSFWRADERDFPVGHASSRPAPVSAVSWGHTRLERKPCPT